MPARRTVLVAEDDANDACFLEMAFRKAEVDHKLVRVKNGQEVLDYLSGKPPYDDRAEYPLPDVVILDLNMPGVDGFDVLQWMQQRPTLNIPALVLTSSSLETDKSRTQSLGAKGYFVKPSNPFELTGIVRELDTQWLTRAGRKREKKMNL